MAIIVVDWTDFLIKLALIMALYLLAGIALGIGVGGLIMRYEYRQRCKQRELEEESRKQRELAALEAQEGAMWTAVWAEVGKILARESSQTGNGSVGLVSPERSEEVKRRIDQSK